MVKNIILMAAIIAHFVLVGADIFAQVAITPVALSAPPASLTMYQGEYVYNSTVFWKPTNMIALGLLVVALAVHWRTSRRNLLLVWLVGSIIISILSLGYIFPEYTEIVSATYSNTVDPELVERGATWRVIAFARLLVFAGIGVLPLMALSKQPEPDTDAG